jgi:cystathionine beta-lyase/cystathionine gamma-synthase
LEEIKMVKKNTKIVHEKVVEPQQEKPAIPPIYQTSTFEFPRAELLGDTISGGPDNEVFIYTRGSNPTQRTLEKSLASMAGSEEALTTSSGMAAITLIALTFLRKGDHAIVSEVTYGDTHHLFSDMLKDFGVEVDFVDFTSPKKIEETIKSNTRLIFFETPSNPLLRLVDIKAVSQLAKENKIKTIVDNTIMTPLLQDALGLGADIEVHSLTKYINGHSDVVGGAILCSKKDFLELRKTLFTTGAILDPHAAWLVQRGLKTLALRLKKHQENTKKVVKFLSENSSVQRVNHPYLREHPDNKLALTQMKGFPSVLSFEIKGDLKDARRFINNLRLFKKAVSLGGVESLAEHPASMTHAIIPKAEREKAGIMDNLIRLSIGIEDADDLIEDLKQALN